jgi:uncharacterized membrane-anchored protein YitT (DUF2179 family)
MKKNKMKDEKLKRAIIFVIGVFILAMTYNIFVIPNNFVIGGSSGLAIVAKAIFHIDPVIFIYVVDILLLVVSYIFLGFDDTWKSTVGSLLYPFLISITGLFTNYLIPYFTFDNIIITICFTGSLLGLGFGLVYKTGYTTGGGDIIKQILHKYNKMPTGKAAVICDIVVIGLGTFALGMKMVVYSSIIIVISSIIIDKILIGISDSKMFIINSKEYVKIQDTIVNKLATGVTLINAQGGYNEAFQPLLMVVIPTKEFYLLKDTVLEIDPDAFFVVSDCYETKGGMKRKNLPFI